MKHQKKNLFLNAIKHLRKVVVLSVFMLGFSELNAQKFWELIEQEKVSLKEVQHEANAYFSINPTGKGSGYKLYKRWEYWAQRNLDENGYVISEKQQLRQFRVAKSSSKQNRNINNSNWKELGPLNWTRTSSWSPGLGRITAIAVEPAQQQVIFAGSPGGGLWRSLDAGASWTPLGDDFDDMHIWAIEIDPNNPNIVYYGNLSGEVYKSTNQGDSWSLLGDYGFKCRRILINPNNSNIVLVATASGIYKSINAGSTFTLVNNVGVEDLEFKPNDTNVIYASGYRVYRSTNGGDTFNEVFISGNGSRRTKIAVTSANSEYVYAIQNKGGGFGRVLRSTDGGTSFQTQNDVDNPGGFNYLGSQATRDMAIMVSQTNPDEVHIGGLNHYRSTDGAVTFTGLATWSAPSDPSYVHADIEVMKYIGSKLYVGSDGGIFRSLNQGNNYEDLTQNGLGVHQFYRIGNAKNNSNKVTGGSQDNGTIMMRSNNRSFVSWAGADGMESFFDPYNDSIAYQAIQFGSLGKTKTSGDTRIGIGKPTEAPKGRWVTPFAPDPIKQNWIYAGYDELYRNRDGGELNSWENLTDSLTNTFSGYPLMDEMAIAESNNNFIYIVYGTKVYMTKNGESTTPYWKEISPSSSGFINYIHVDPNDEKHVVICGSLGSVKKSSDAGETWAEVTGLPSITVQTVIFDNTDNNGLYAGLNKGGVYYTNDNQSGWTQFSTNLPNVEVRDLEIDYVSNHLRVGTYGRGLWESPLETVQPINLVAPSTVTLSKDNSSGDVTISWIDNSTGEIGHRIEFAANENSTDFIEIGATSDLSYLEKLFTNTNYVFRVRAVDALGNFSPYSEVASFNTQDVCANIPAYDNGFLYMNAGHQVVFEGNIYENTQTVQGNKPTNVAAPWISIASCNNAVSHTITASSGTNGTISPSGSVSILSGENSTFIITSNSGYSISDVLVDNISQGNITSYTFNSVMTDHTISASFVEDSNGGGNSCTAADWNASTIYSQPGTEVVYQGIQYASLWWNQNNAPGGNNSPWRVVMNCDGSGVDCSLYPDYNNSTIYSTVGTRVVYLNGVYSNNWTIQGNPPGNNPSWTFVGPCMASSVAAPIIAGTEEEQNESDFAIHVLVWPNPSRDNININFDAPVRNASFELINVAGEVVASKVLLNGTMLTGLDVSELPKGVYYIKASGDRLNETMSVIIK